MKPLYLSIALALGTVSVMPDAFASLTIVDSNVAYLQHMQIKNDRLKARLAQHGLSKKNRPQLFSLIEQRLEQDASSANGLDPSSSQNCTSGRPELCSFFKHMGIEPAISASTGEQFVVLSALNSKTVPTDYTLIDLRLINEKASSLLTRHTMNTLEMEMKLSVNLYIRMSKHRIYFLSLQLRNVSLQMAGSRLYTKMPIIGR
ncbi:hypothetical protein AC626_18685 [Pseudoalteromonas rubra]|uniref:Uncharacterized protein n=1 Tax=Pseudoalteromonas rubra TaxID=43658 RepID=A0A0L0EP63_9GAMM|nr:hypothetical protein AC626_18685 [Pseudoalteromonas rubra]